MKHDFSVFGERLRTQRKKKKLTQEQLGVMVWPIPSYMDKDQIPALTDTARKKINNYENGTFPKNYADLCRICDVLDCSLDYLFGEIDHPTWDIQRACDTTGLDEFAVTTLAYLNDRDEWTLANMPQPINALRFYSEFIKNNRLFSTILASTQAIDKIREFGLSESESQVFRSDEPEYEALCFYLFQLEQETTNFINQFVRSPDKSKKLETFYHIGDNSPENKEHVKQILHGFKHANKGDCYGNDKKD